MCKYGLSVIVKVKRFTGPCPCRTGGSLWNFKQMCGMFSFETDLLKVPLLSTTSAHSVQSFAVLCFQVSSFATSVTGVLQEWKLLAFSTRLRTCSMASVAPVTAPTVTRLCRFLTLLVFSQFSILDIIHFYSLLHPVQVVLGGNFQPCYFYDSVQCHFMTLLYNLGPNLFTGNFTNDGVS